MTVEFLGLDAIEKAILDARCAVLTRDPHKAVDHLAKAIELLRKQWDEKYGQHLADEQAEWYRTQYRPLPDERKAVFVEEIQSDVDRSYWGVPRSLVTSPEEQEAANQRARGMMNAIAPTHEERVRQAFRAIRQSAEDLVYFERIVYGVPGEDDPPHGEGDRLRRANEAERPTVLMEDLGRLEPESIPVASLGERVTKLMNALAERRDMALRYRHGLTNVLNVVDAERAVDHALNAVRGVIAYDWGEHKPDPIKLSLLDRIEAWLNRPKAPWYKRYTNYPGPW